ncbi:MAG: hypothetical protein JOY82_18010 [Streptosporangiaceae bacterium]|nr:hypothetical protein [Streptosporangiaceae bacterium]MBV9856383.1 hypothetical protein [Streptosporangiaceae bacterium]
MTLLLVVLIAAIAGYRIRRWRAAAIPPILGAAVLLFARSSDSPIPFLIVISTIAVTVGVALGRKRVRLSADHSR